jgi:hypothetical protein
MENLAVTVEQTVSIALVVVVAVQVVEGELVLRVLDLTRVQESIPTSLQPEQMLCMEAAVLVGPVEYLALHNLAAQHQEVVCAMHWKTKEVVVLIATDF